MKNLFFILVILLFFSSCAKDNNLELYQPLESLEEDINCLNAFNFMVNYIHNDNLSTRSNKVTNNYKILNIEKETFNFLIDTILNVNMRSSLYNRN